MYVVFSNMVNTTINVKTFFSGPGQAGELLSEMDVKAGDSQLSHDATIGLDDLGINRTQSYLYNAPEHRNPIIKLHTILAAVCV